MIARRRPPAAGQSVTGSVVFGSIIQVSGVDGDVTISSGSPPPYRVANMDPTRVPLSPEQARAQPSRLLLARHQVVPFTGRDAELGDLAGWMGDAGAVSVRLVHAAGGQGKTRLAAHVAGHAAAGWVVWRVLHTPDPDPASESRATRPAGGGVLAVVDYADRWPASHLLALVTHLHALSLRTSIVVRVLMLARSAGFWWPALTDRLDSDLGVDADAMLLPPLAGHGRPGGAVHHGSAAVRRRVGLVDVANWPTPAGLDGPGYGQVLAVHMGALAAVDAHRLGTAAPTHPYGVSAYLLRREYAHWQHLHARVEDRLDTPPAVMRRTAYVATLTGALSRRRAGPSSPGSSWPPPPRPRIASSTTTAPVTRQTIRLPSWRRCTPTGSGKT